MFKLNYKIVQEENDLYYLYITCNCCEEFYLEGTVSEDLEDPVFMKWLNKYKKGTMEPLCKDCTYDLYFKGNLLKWLEDTKK